MIYKILHPVNGEMNHNCDLASFQYEVVAEVEQEDAQEGIRTAQRRIPIGLPVHEPGEQRVKEIQEAVDVVLHPRTRRYPIFNVSGYFICLEWSSP